MKWYRLSQAQQSFDWYNPREHFETMSDETLEGPVSGGGDDDDDDDDGEGEYPDLVFHGTSRQNFGNIVSEGLVPSIGAFVDSFYGGEEGEESEDLLFFSKREDLDRAFGAMVFQVGKSMGSEWPYSTVTLDDVSREGVLIAVDASPDMYEYDRPEYGESKELMGEYREYGTPTSVEPGDVWSRESQSPSLVMTGPSLVRAIMEFDPDLYGRLSNNGRADQ
jgi:hypothetical protein